jgi:hypothetical protein
LTFCKEFRHPTARVTLVDRTNHHLFQPLLYQVATAGLSPAEVAQPTRAILSRYRNVTVLLERAVDLDLPRRRVSLEKVTLDYDFLVLALGGVTSYFGHPEWEPFAPGLKSLDDATRIRREILLAFEKAETEPDLAEQDRLMTIVVVGGGPTGVELAGAFAELARNVLRRDFRRIDPGRARIILIEASPIILSHLPRDLAESAQRQLENLGVQVRASTRVKAIRQGEVELEAAPGAVDHGGDAPGSPACVLNGSLPPGRLLVIEIEAATKGIQRLEFLRCGQLVALEIGGLDGPSHRLGGRNTQSLSKMFDGGGGGRVQFQHRVHPVHGARLSHETLFRQMCAESLAPRPSCGKPCPAPRTCPAPEPSWPCWTPVRRATPSAFTASASTETQRRKEDTHEDHICQHRPRAR